MISKIIAFFKPEMPLDYLVKQEQLPDARFFVVKKRICPRCNTDCSSTLCATPMLSRGYNLVPSYPQCMTCEWIFYDD